MEVARKKCQKWRTCDSATCFSATRVTIRFYSVVARHSDPVNTFPAVPVASAPARDRGPVEHRRMFDPTRAAAPDPMAAPTAAGFEDDEPPVRGGDIRSGRRSRPLWTTGSGRPNSIRSVVSSVTSSPSPRMSGSDRPAGGDYKLAIPPYYFSLIDDDPADRSAFSRAVAAGGREPVRVRTRRPARRGKDSPVPGLTHRYPDRVLLITSRTADVLPILHPQARHPDPRRVGGLSADDERMIGYVRSHPEIRDVIISGGDPLTLPSASSASTWRTSRPSRTSM